MANPESKWLKAISVLNALTQKGDLRWQMESPKGILAKAMVDAEGGQTFKAQYADKWIRLRQKTRSQQGFFAVEEGPSLEIIDESGNTLYKIPETTGLNDLYQSVQYQLSGVDNLLNSLLNDPRS